MAGRKEFNIGHFWRGKADKVASILEYRMLEQVRAVPDVVGRTEVRQMAEVVQAENPPAESDAANELFANLVNCVAVEANRGPFLLRLLAVIKIGRMAQQGVVNISTDSSLGAKLIEAMQTEPFPSGGPILAGALKAQLEPDAQQGQPYERIEWPKDLSDDKARDRWERKVMIEEAADMFRSNPDLSMVLPEWRSVAASDYVSDPDGSLEGPGVPKLVLRLQALTRAVRGKYLQAGQVRSHICSIDMQNIAGAFGMPLSNRYDQAGYLLRNPTIVRTFNRLALDDGSTQTRRQGIAIPALTVMNENRRGQLQEQIIQSGGLNSEQVVEQIPASGLLYIAAVRTLRALSSKEPRKQRSDFYGAARRVIAAMRREVDVIEMVDGEPKRQKTVQIFKSYVDQLNHERSGGVATTTEQEAAACLETSLAGLLLTHSPSTGDPVVRTESDLYRLMNNMATRTISEEDRRAFPELLQPTLSTETIQRRPSPVGKTFKEKDTSDFD